MSERKYIIARDRGGKREYLVRDHYDAGRKWSLKLSEAEKHDETEVTVDGNSIYYGGAYLLPLRPKGQAKRPTREAYERAAAAWQNAEKERDAARAEVARLTADRTPTYREELLGHLETIVGLRRELDEARSTYLANSIESSERWAKATSDAIVLAYECAARKCKEVAAVEFTHDRKMGATDCHDAIRLLANLAPAPGPDERVYVRPCDCNARLAAELGPKNRRIAELEKERDIAVASTAPDRIHWSGVVREKDARIAELEAAHRRLESVRCELCGNVPNAADNAAFWAEIEAEREQARADQREEDARICEGLSNAPDPSDPDGGTSSYHVGADECAQAIRAGGVPTVETFTAAELSLRSGRILDKPIAPTESAPVKKKRRTCPRCGTNAFPTKDSNDCVWCRTPTAPTESAPVETKDRPWTDDEARRYGEVPACLMDKPIAPTDDEGES